MPAEAFRSEDTKAWLLKASQDLRRVPLLLALTPPDIEDALFHAQQAVEKAFKALLTWHDVPFQRVHDLDALGSQCVDLDASLREIAARAEGLSAYAVRFRYPGAPYQPSLEEARAAEAIAREVFEAILARLPEEVRP